MTNFTENLASAAEPIDGSDLLDELCGFIRSHVKMSEDDVVLTALWIVWTWTSDQSYFQPRLAIISPEPGCGKTTLLRLLELLVRDPESSASITPAALFRTIEKLRPTILIDEADTFFTGNDELRGVINAGFEKTGAVTRCVGDDNAPKKFLVACPCAIAAIGTLPGTVMDRSIVIEMQRKAVGETLQSLRVDRPTRANAIRGRIEEWAADIHPHLDDYEPNNLPRLSSDRTADKMRPLISIADQAGDHWPTKARRAALMHDHNAQVGRTPTNGVQLLTDLRAIRDDQGVMQFKTKDLIAKLLALEESPWNDVGPRGRPLDPRGLAQLLKPYKIFPSTMRFGSETAKGYNLEDFEDAFNRYLQLPGKPP